MASAPSGEHPGVQVDLEAVVAVAAAGPLLQPAACADLAGQPASAIPQHTTHSIYSLTEALFTNKRCIIGRLHWYMISIHVHITCLMKAAMSWG